MRTLTTSALFIVIVYTTDACMRVTPVTPGMPATQCKKCGQIAIAPIGDSNRAFKTTPARDDTGACSTWTFVCDGERAAITFGESTIVDGKGYDPDPTANQVTLVATCANDGSYKIKLKDGEDYPVTAPVECYTFPPNPCESCPPLNPSPGETGGEIAFTDNSYIVDNSGTCATHKLECLGEGATIGFDFQITDGEEGDPDMMTNQRIALEAICNREGTGWIILGNDVNTAPSCFLRTPDKCTQCTELVHKSVPTNGPNGYRNFTSITPGTLENGCLTTTSLCEGELASIATGEATIDDGTKYDPDMMKNGAVEVVVICNDEAKWKIIVDGRAYDVSKMECSYLPPLPG